MRSYSENRSRLISFKKIMASRKCSAPAFRVFSSREDLAILLDAAAPLLWGLSMPMMIVGIGSLTLFRLSCALCILIALLKCRRGLASGNRVLIVVAACVVATTVVSVLSHGFSSQWSKSAVGAFLGFFEVLLVYFLYLRTASEEELLCAIQGFKLGCLITLGWALLQAVVSVFAGININAIVFKWSKYYASSASLSANGVIATGLGWHASCLTPVVIATAVLFKNPLPKLLACIVAIASRSATAVVGIALALIILGFIRVKQSHKTPLSQRRISRYAAFCGIGLMAVGGLVFVSSPELVDVAIDAVAAPISRIANPNGDMSSATHLYYYTGLPMIFERLPIENALFGIGLGESGYWFSQFANQYSGFGPWAVESDPVNTLLGMGIIGAFFFYGWLISFMIGCGKRFSRIAILLAVFLIVGVFYNVQFEWVFGLEVLLLAYWERCHDGSSVGCEEVLTISKPKNEFDTRTGLS